MYYCVIIVECERGPEKKNYNTERCTLHRAAFATVVLITPRVISVLSVERFAQLSHMGPADYALTRARLLAAEQRADLFDHSALFFSLCINILYLCVYNKR